MISSKIHAVATSARSSHANSGGEQGGANADVAVGWGDLEGGGKGQCYLLLSTLCIYLSLIHI